MAKYFKSCEFCGGALDAGEKCDCQKPGETVNRRAEEAAKRLKQLMTADLHKNNIEIRFSYLTEKSFKHRPETINGKEVRDT